MEIKLGDRRINTFLIGGISYKVVRKEESSDSILDITIFSSTYSELGAVKFEKAGNIWYAALDIPVGKYNELEICQRPDGLLCGVNKDNQIIFKLEYQ